MYIWVWTLNKKKLYIDTIPPYPNIIETLDQIYYAQICTDDGVGMGLNYKDG